MSKFSHERVLETVPTHLRSFIVDQNYSRYTAQDQAVWRYIMRKNIHFLGKHAHPSYLTGLEKTGISLNKIPDVEEMNEALDKIGWRAVVVNGFIPPAAFMEFQAHRILVISAEMRTIEHILYTPAPDIVHEAAGHAPIIADEAYAEYLQKFGEYGSKAMASKMDFEVYEAIRHLSIIKEFPNTSEEEIKRAEADLNMKIEANKDASEAALLSRLHWWTVEYGLVGTIDDFKQYGAGLLSSVGESEHCMSSQVSKIPLTVDCINYNYDITTMQPQLFVARDWYHLIEVLEEYASTMCFRTGGVGAIKKAIESENVATLEFSSGIQISGILTQIETTEQGDISYLQFKGPSALASHNTQIEDHGTETHKDGFGSPVGKLIDSNTPLESFKEGELNKYGLIPENRTTLTFESGIVVEGVVEKIKHNDQMIQLISFRDCEVKGQKGELLFRREWGTYDMAIGSCIRSVFAGTADKEKYNVLPPKSEEIAIEIDHSEKRKQLFSLYKNVSHIRNQDTVNIESLSQIGREIDTNHPDEWLLHIEIAEIAKKSDQGKELEKESLDRLEALKEHSEEYQNLINDGLKLI